MEQHVITVALSFTLLALFKLSFEDIWNRRLPNVWVGFYAFIFLGVAFGLDFGWEQISLHLLVAFITLVIAAGLFALRWLGGGDVKLWAAVMLWAGPHLWLQALVIGTLAGAVVALLSLLAAKLTRLPRAPGQRFWRLLSADRGVPYGVGLSLAGIYVLYVYLQTVLQLRYAA